MNISYRIEGLYRGEWTTLFAPIATSREAQERMLTLKKRNPACRYRIRWQHINPEPIVEQR